MVANEVWIHPWSLVSIPGKDVNVSFKELYQFLPLLLRYLGSDLKKLLQIVSYCDFHKIFTFHLIGCPTNR